MFGFGYLEYTDITTTYKINKWWKEYVNDKYKLSLIKNDVKYKMLYHYCEATNIQIKDIDIKMDNLRGLKNCNDDFWDKLFELRDLSEELLKKNIKYLLYNKL